MYVNYGNKSVIMREMLTSHVCKVENCVSDEIGANGLSLKKESVNQLVTFCVLIQLYD